MSEDMSFNMCTNMKTKKVKFSFVETKYYHRRIGCITNKPGIKLGASFEPFETTRVYFGKHNPSTCYDCLIKKKNKVDHISDCFEDTSTKVTDEKLCEFYNIHGLANHRAPGYNQYERLKLLLESGACVEDIKVTLTEQSEYLKELHLTEMKEKIEKYVDGEMFLMNYKTFPSQKEKKRKTGLLYKDLKQKARRKILIFERDLEEQKRNYETKIDNFIEEFLCEIKAKEKTSFDEHVNCIASKLEDFHIGVTYKELNNDKTCLILKKAKPEIEESVLNNIVNEKVSKLIFLIERML